MASCPASVLQTQACENNFKSLASEEVLSRAVELEQLYLIAGETAPLSELYSQACANGFDKVAAIEALSNTVELQQLCNISGGT